MRADLAVHWALVIDPTDRRAVLKSMTGPGGTGADGAGIESDADEFGDLRE